MQGWSETGLKEMLAKSGCKIEKNIPPVVAVTTEISEKKTS